MGRYFQNCVYKREGGVNLLCIYIEILKSVCFDVLGIFFKHLADIDV